MGRLSKKCQQEYALICKQERENIKGKFMSYIFRKYEAIILNKVLQEFKADVLMYDGFIRPCEAQ